jgi:phosphoribosyl 1,2-cyclic phosphodiesterase
MRFTSLGSGSKGNATLIQAGATTVLVDCGFGLKEAESRLRTRGIEPGQLSAIMVTHEHGDHLRGAPMLSRKHGVPVYATPGTARFFKTPVPLFEPINVHRRFRIGDLEIEPVTVPHDAREPVQFVFEYQQFCMGVLTDLGSITPLVTRSYQRCQALLLECNHDPDMLANGPYPASLKRRVGGDWGHLSNQQAAQLLATLELGGLQHLMISHMSELNYQPDLAMAALAPFLEKNKALTVHTLTQDGGCPWIPLQPA